MGIKASERLNHALVYLVLGILTVIFIFPLLWILSNSLKTYEQIFGYPPKLFPLPLQFSNYVDALFYQSLPFTVFFRNSFIITIFSAVGAVFSSALVSFSFSRLRWKGRNTLFFIVIITMIIPVEVMITPQFIIYNQIGWLDTWLPLIVPMFFGRPFYIFVLRQAMMGIPMEMDESATIDGCTTLQLFWRIILPQSKLALIAIAIYVIQDQWNNYLEPLIFVNTTAKLPIAVGLGYFSGMYQTQWHLVFAAAVMTAAPIFILFAFLQKYFIQGVVISGVKG